MPIAQFLLEPQPPQPPPQSRSVSLPFITPSLHSAATHLLAVQTRFAQSLPTVQALPVTQRLQELVPPQSTSDSPPFLVTSEQLGT